MTDDEKHQRTMNLNAHFAWALALWGSAEVAREDGNPMLVPIGYYYSAFHSGFAFLNASPKVPLSALTRMVHTRLRDLLEGLLPFMRIQDLSLLREVRETINYLGGGDPAHKLRIVRGHPFGFDINDKPYTYEQSLELASDVSKRFIFAVMDGLSSMNKLAVNRIPTRGDEAWLDEYLQEDVLLGVIPRGATGVRVLKKAFSFLD
jgi:hypothetical protein